MIENFTEQGVRHAALNMAWRVVFAWWFTVLLLVGIGGWCCAWCNVFVGFTPGTWIAICSTSMATLMLLFNVSCRYIEYRIGRAERVLQNTQKINERLSKLMCEAIDGKLLKPREIIFELMAIADCINFQEVDLMRINLQYIKFMDSWLLNNSIVLRAFVEFEKCDLRILFMVVKQLEEVGEYEETAISAVFD